MRTPEPPSLPSPDHLRITDHQPLTAILVPILVPVLVLVMVLVIALALAPVLVFILIPVSTKDAVCTTDERNSGKGKTQKERKISGRRYTENHTRPGQGFGRLVTPFGSKLLFREPVEPIFASSPGAGVRRGADNPCPRSPLPSWLLSLFPPRLIGTGSLLSAQFAECSAPSFSHLVAR